MRIFAALLLLAFIGSVYSGQTATGRAYKVPEEAPVVTVHVSKRWKTQEHEEYIEAVSPDGNSHVLVLPVEGNKVTEATGEAMRHVRRRGGIMVKPESFKEEKVEIGTKELPLLSWDATEHGRPLKIRCYLFSAQDGRRAILFTWAPAEIKEENRQELSRILKSVRTH